MSVPSTVQCHQCQYSLRGLPDDGDCPECGTAVQTTLAAHNRLDAYGERKDRRTRVAACIVFGLVALNIILLITACVMVATGISSGFAGGLFRTSTAVFTWIPAVTALALFIAYFFWWQIRTRAAAVFVVTLSLQALSNSVLFNMAIANV